MTHVFVAPHPDDIALSCGGLSPYQREMADAVRSSGRAIAEFGRVDGSAERYWVSGRV